MRVKIKMKNGGNYDIKNAILCDKREYITNVYTEDNEFTFVESTEDILSIMIDEEEI